VRLSPFWAKRQAVWFAQAEVQFALAGIRSEKIKFCHVITQLDHRYATEVDDIITPPPDQDPYTTLRTELMRRLSPSREQRIRQLLMLEEMGDQKPSRFLRHVRILAPDVPYDFFRRIWSCRLPPNIQAILAGQPKGSLDAAACCADRISEVAPQPALVSVSPLPDSTTLLQEIEDLALQAAALSAEQDRLRISFRDPCVRSMDTCSSFWYPLPGSRNRPPGGRSPSRDGTASTLCWYHCLFGARAQKCTQSCAYRQQGN
jgi:hypothetical protein